MVIAIVFGAIGYATREPEVTQIPPLADVPPGPGAASGEIVSLEGGRITIVTETGEPLEYVLPDAVMVEMLEPINLAAVEIGDWINGGAIPHPATILALEQLVLLPEPVTP